MPHCVVEYSQNIPDKVNFKEFFQKLHQIMVDTGAFKLERIKSRVITHNNYYIGDGNSENTFVYLQISILTGRELPLRKKLSGDALDLIKTYFPKALAQMKCSMTVDIREMDKEAHSSLT
jgi:5-carboxymethyl-2-hydroxymuconate isomerase